jgi:hypothetical protein
MIHRINISTLIEEIIIKIEIIFVGLKQQIATLACF